MAEEDGDRTTVGGGLANALAISWIAALSLLLSAAILTTIFGNPYVGDPLVRMAVHKAINRSEPEGRLSHAGQTANPSPPSVPSASPPAITKPVYAGGALVADPALLEPGATGALPRISADGRTPMAAYAGMLPPDSKGPRIVIIVNGLGISARQTEAALESLPPAVTLAFAPYADDVGHWVTEARRLGHEVLLAVPMEANQRPGQDPGPHTLRADPDTAANIQRLDWALGRFTGYVGVTNMQGGRFLADSGALTPIMDALAKRGLLFLDDGDPSHSAATDAASRTGIAFARSNLQLDGAGTASDIDEKLAELERSARTRGYASGTVNLTPLALARIQFWAATLRDAKIVPASAIASPARTE